MREISEQAGSADLIARMDMALHGLCQPLTVLQCRLAIGELIGEPDAMREAIREGLQECARMNRTVGTMREMLQKVLVDSEERTR
ncbi:MAG TPA: hypothetical protein VNU92_03775 [Edaphobacter sp.]|nr:hypothetical protein [Edaphobacter sp.]